MIKDGIHNKISPREYHAWEFDRTKGPISTSTLKRYVEEGPERFINGEKKKVNASMAWGSLVDLLLFTPEHFEGEFVLSTDCDDLSSDGSFRTAAAREWRDGVLAEGRRIVKPDDLSRGLEAVKKLSSTPASARLLEGSQYQVGLVFTSEHGIPAKGLVDCLPVGEDCIVDLKTTGANLHDDSELERTVGKFRYHVQAAFYLYLWSKLSDERRREWKIIWQSSVPPFEVRVDKLDNLMLDAGQEFVRYHVPRIVRDIKTDSWRSPFSEGETILRMHNPTVFAEEALMERLTEMEL